MLTVRSASIFAVGIAMLGVAACTSNTAKTAAEPAPVVPPFPVNIDPANFGDDSTTIDNEWWPLKPGTRWIWEGTALDEDEEIERRVVFTVTDLTKEIAGITTLVGWDQDYNDGVLLESEIIFLAQDKEGNVWHFGQYAELYDEEGAYEGGTAWLVGYLEGAKAGILMPGDPQLGTPQYSQGFAPPPYFWDDYGRVRRMGQETCVEAGCYSDVMIIEEFEPTIPDAFQLKYYARGTGVVRIGWRGDDDEQEEMELVEVSQLTPAELAVAHAEALKLEARANVYGLTVPIQQPTVSPTP